MNFQFSPSRFYANRLIFFISFKYATVVNMLHYRNFMYILFYFI